MLFGKSKYMNGRFRLKNLSFLIMTSRHNNANLGIDLEPNLLLELSGQNLQILKTDYSFHLQGTNNR